MHTITVAEVIQTTEMRAVVVKKDMPLAKVIDQFVHDSRLRGVFVTDANGRLCGVVNKHDLLNWVRLEFALPPSSHALPVAQARRLLLAETVGDLARADSLATAVTLQDSLAVVLDKMIRYDLDDIPVIDGDGRVVNDLRLSEILAFILQSDTLSTRKN